jgi:HSP20 family protein
MSIVRWSPFREMEAMHNEMNRLFSRFGGFDGEQKSGSQWMLTVDVIETQDALKLKAALPGIDPKDVNIEVNDNTLTLMAERRQEDKVEEGSYQWIEHQYGTFSRSITLPRHVDTEKIEARYNNGMLELTVPKKESAKPRRIELQTSGSSGNEGRTLEASSQSSGAPKQLQTENAGT